MQAKQTNVTGTNAGQGMPSVESALLDVKQVASLTRCSQRTVYRLVDAGKMPRPVKLGSLVRWRRAEILKWIIAGCPSVRVAKGGAR